MKIDKTLIIFLIILLPSCNSQTKNKLEKETKESQKTHTRIGTKNNISKEPLDFLDFRFKANINEVLSRIGLTLNENVLNEYHISGDYEEFKFAPHQIKIFDNNIDLQKNETSLFYTKKDKLVWCYEINVLDNNDAVKILKGFEDKYGTKPAYSKISLSTKEHPLFLDENGRTHFSMGRF